MNTTVYFIWDKYGNYQDRYFTNKYTDLINHFTENVVFEWKGNLGISDGVVIRNNFNGNFTKVNCAIVDHPTLGKHLYKIIKKQFIRKDMWNITMIKDLVSSNLSNIENSKILVSRLGMSRDVPDPLLFIPEEMQLSQVKKAQTLISEVPNKVAYGYVLIWKRGSLDGTIKWKSVKETTEKWDIEVATLNDLPFYNDKSLPIRLDASSYVTCPTSTGDEGLVVWEGYPARDIPCNRYEVELENNITPTKKLNSHKQGVNGFYTYRPFDDDTSILTKLEATIQQHNAGGLNIVGWQTYSGKVVKAIDSGSYYEIVYTNPVEVIKDYPIKQYMAYILGKDATEIYETGDEVVIRVIENHMTYKLVKMPYYDEVNELTFSKYPNLVDQPFQMIFTPIMDDMEFVGEDQLKRFVTSKIATEEMIYDLISNYSGDNGKLIDVQLVPYAPIVNYMRSYDESGWWYLPGNATDMFKKGKVIIPIYPVIFSSFSKIINTSLTIQDYKLEQKKKYILTTPSGAGNYEFSPAKNKGLTGYNIKVDLRPFASFYSLQPIYKGLYGTNFVDTRGLVWQEDSSLTMITNQWETYKRNNINYLNSMDAELDFKKSQQTIQHEANWGNYAFDASKRLIEAGVTAATFAAEATANDVWGVKGLASGAVGAAAIMGGQIVSEALDAGQLAYNNKKEGELLANEIAYTQKQFNYSLGNIKALPENLEKVSGLFQTNNYIPYLQVFEPTKEEIVIYENYLDTFGVNLGLMVDLRNREYNYLQGTLIKYDGETTNEEYVEMCKQLNLGVRKYTIGGE